jgi:hypothetical protein
MDKERPNLKLNLEMQKTRGDEAPSKTKSTAKKPSKKNNSKGIIKL